VKINLIFLVTLIIAFSAVSVLAGKNINNCEKQVARYKKICDEEPNATNMDACFNYKVFKKWCFDPSVTQKNQPYKACVARSAVMRQEGKAQAAKQNDRVCAMFKKQMK